MNLCDDGHDEICFEARQCPACKLLEQIDQIEDRLKDAKAEIAELSRAANG